MISRLTQNQLQGRRNGRLDSRVGKRERGTERGKIGQRTHASNLEAIREISTAIISQQAICNNIQRVVKRDIIVVPLEFLKLIFLAAVVFSGVESTLDAKVAKISTECIKKELVFVVVLYPNVAIFSQTLIELLSGFTR